jgi:Xaa-Pro dipeptidase
MSAGQPTDPGGGTASPSAPTSQAPSSPPRLLDPRGLQALRGHLEELGVDGWLLYDFRDQNPLAHRLLELGKTTRRSFALFPVRGDPVLLRHAIEASAWRHWPWGEQVYAGWEDLARALPHLLRGLETVAMETSPGGDVPTVDRVPAGTLDAVRASGVSVVSSGDLVTRYHSSWGEGGLASHLRAADVVRDTVHAAFHRAAQAAGNGSPVREAELMAWIRDRLRQGGLSHQVDCSVATGRNASDPHYHPRGDGDPLEGNSLVLIDLWGAEAGGIPADQTWMAWLGDDPDPRTLQVFEAVRRARDRALDLLRERARAGEEVRGYEVDRASREILAEEGLEPWFVHRLGHSIDGDLHGSGPNLDDLETKDIRRILPDTGFSVEPGVYIPGEMGVRSEVNVYWGPEGPVVTPSEIQTELLRVPLGRPGGNPTHR